jgi:hypothetical protein
MKTHPPFTVGDLRSHLKLFADDFELTFGPVDTLTFYRTKQRGDKLVNIEFNEIFTVEETEPFPGVEPTLPSSSK